MILKWRTSSFELWKRKGSNNQINQRAQKVIGKNKLLVPPPSAGLRSELDAHLVEVLTHGQCQVRIGLRFPQSLEGCSVNSTFCFGDFVHTEPRARSKAQGGRVAQCCGHCGYPQTRYLNHCQPGLSPATCLKAYSWLGASHTLKQHTRVNKLGL